MGQRLHKMSKHTPSVFQGRLDFSSVHRHFSLTVEHPAERTTFRVLAATLLFLGLCYLYFVGASVLNVIARKEALTQTANLASAVSHLERDYFAASQKVTPEAARRLGLSPIEKTVYVYRPGNAAAATISTNEI